MKDTEEKQKKRKRTVFTIDIELSWIIIILFAVVVAIATVSTTWAQQPSGQSGNWWEDSIWSDPDRGFNWYPPDVPVKKQKKEEKTILKLEKITTMEALQKEIQRRKDIAIMSPTYKNVLAYEEAKNFIMDKASMFADVSRRVVWDNPQVDYNTVNPNANFAQVAIKENRNINTDNLMKSLAKTHGIVFFFRSDCEYCHIQAPIIKMMREFYGMEVLPISMDGRTIKDFPEARFDNGISIKVSKGRGIQTVPATYLVSKDQKTIIPLGAGVLALDEIVDRIRVLTTTSPGQAF